MKTFSQLPVGKPFRSNSGLWRKIFPRPNTERRHLPPWNAIKLDPPAIAPNLWKNAAAQAEHGNTALADELNLIAASPVYGTFPDGFLVSDVEELTPAVSE